MRMAEYGRSVSGRNRAKVCDIVEHVGGGKYLLRTLESSRSRSFSRYDGEKTTSSKLDLEGKGGREIRRNGVQKGLRRIYRVHLWPDPYMVEYT